LSALTLTLLSSKRASRDSEVLSSSEEEASKRSECRVNSLTVLFDAYYVVCCYCVAL
jgi:hypothetical protein